MRSQECRNTFSIVIGEGTKVKMNTVKHLGYYFFGFNTYNIFIIILLRLNVFNISFNSILDIYRIGVLHLDVGFCPLVLQKDLEYWEIDEDIIGMW